MKRIICTLIIMLCMFSTNAQSFTTQQQVISELNIDSNTETIVVKYSDMLKLKDGFATISSELLANRMLFSQCLKDLHFCNLEAEAAINTIMFESNSTNNFYIPWYVWTTSGFMAGFLGGAATQGVFDKNQKILNKPASIIIGIIFGAATGIIMTSLFNYVSEQ